MSFKELLENAKEDLLLGREEDARRKVEYHYRQGFRQHQRDTNDFRYFNAWLESLGMPRVDKGAYSRIFKEKVEDARRFSTRLYNFLEGWINVFSDYMLGSNR
jgi:hypothetical protein